LTETGSLHFTSTISPTSNQVSSTAGQQPQTFTYDAAGNTTSFNGATFTYYQRGRISSRTTTGGTTNYYYNALGEMIEKTGIGGNVLFMYDEHGHLVTEYGGSNNLLEETVWMGNVPVGVIQPSGSSVALYYIHTDHLNTPRKVTRPSDNGLMWRWDPDTYGLPQPNNNPAGLGAFTYNLRFAGQYFMNESWLFTNYFRTYNPQQGRYLESDPIGLAGGSYSMYRYANSNPISFDDPLGLCADRQQCENIRRNIEKKLKLFKENYDKYDPEQDYYGGFNMDYGTGTTKPGGHYIELMDLQKGINNDIKAYIKARCMDDDGPGGPGTGSLPWYAFIAAGAIIDVPRPPLPAQAPVPTPNNNTAASILNSLLQSLERTLLP
jgi:RHS repeat-associated protein